MDEVSLFLIEIFGADSEVGDLLCTFLVFELEESLAVLLLLEEALDIFSVSVREVTFFVLSTGVVVPEPASWLVFLSIFLTDLM